MTPREADRIIKVGKPVTVTAPLEDKPFDVLLVSRDRWNVETADGGKFDRGDMKLVRCDGCNNTGELKDGLCALCSFEQSMDAPCPGEAVPSHKMEDLELPDRIRDMKNQFKFISITFSLPQPEWEDEHAKELIKALTEMAHRVSVEDLEKLLQILKRQPTGDDVSQPMTESD